MSTHLAPPSPPRTGPERVSPVRTPERPDLRGRLTAAVLALVAAIGLAMVYAAAVLSSAGQTVDDRQMVEIAARLGEPGWAQQALQLVSPLTVVAAGGAMVAIALARGQQRAALVAAAVLIATVVGAQLLKAELPRPDHLGIGAGNSLPSGHVAATAGVAVAAVLATAARWRPVVALVGTGAVAVVGAATIAWGWHRPSDVLAAGLLALSLGAAGRAMLRH